MMEKVKKYIFRFRRVNRDTWEAIRQGRKKVETRVATVRYRNIRAGDRLVLVYGNDKFEKQIKRAQIFKSIPALLRKYKVQDIEPAMTTAQELAAAYYSYANYREKIKTFGLSALELEL